MGRSGKSYLQRFGDDFARLRKKMGKTQEEVGRIMGLTDGMISHIENGRHPLEPERFEAAAKALGVPIEAIALCGAGLSPSHFEAVLHLVLMCKEPDRYPDLGAILKLIGPE